MTHVINVKKKELNKRNINDFNAWTKMPNTVYIGRNMNVYVKNAHGSIWQNPYSAKKFGRDKCLELYERYIRNNKELYARLNELENKELGCWCSPEKCHGDILIKLLYEQKDNKLI
jgi:hypothetical protein